MGFLDSFACYRLLHGYLVASKVTTACYPNKLSQQRESNKVSNLGITQ